MYKFIELEEANLLSYKEEFSQSQIERAIKLREKLYPIINELLNPQNIDLEAQRIQKRLEGISPKLNLNPKERLYEEKRLRAKLINEILDEILSSQNQNKIQLDMPVTHNDKIWAKQLLIYDLLYYGPITVLAISRILEQEENILNNPIFSLLTNLCKTSQITEIRVNNADEIYFEANNQIHSWQIPFLDNTQLVNIIQRIISESNNLFNANISINSSNPIADFEHPCGYIRGSAVIAPAADPAFLTLRIHPGKPYSIEDLVRFGMLNEAMKNFLKQAQEAGTSIAIAGTMGSGKTTLLSALAELWPNKGRKATIEDTPELKPQIADLVKMRTIDYERDDLRNIDVTRLTKACKRHSVRYVVLSEARDGSAWEILQLSQAILGSLMTFHYTLRSNRHLVDQALNTLTSLCRQHPLAPEPLETKYLIASMVQILILVEQSPIDNIRRIIKIYHVQGFDEMNGGHFKALELFTYDRENGFIQSNQCNEFNNYLELKGLR